MKGKNNTPNSLTVKKDAHAPSPLVAMNPVQKSYIKAILAGGTIICIGVLGSSKTYIPSVMSADMLKAGHIDKIIVARPAEGKSKSLGFFKGTKDEKLEGWCIPVTDTLKARLGPTLFDYHLRVGNIELLALEQVKGRSWSNAFILVDEAEDLRPEVVESLVTRIGENATLVIAGDLNQQDLYMHSGLQHLLDLAEFKETPITLIDFDKWEYCVRSQEAKEWGMAIEKFKKSKGAK